MCSFDFYETYGEIGEDFIKGHHTILVSELEEGHKTKIADIAILCSNCHRMLHRKRP
ncbi:HNH endonuclease [Bacillus cereus]|uniref:HNH endonuclease n=1 Tax=Bacillus cereus TaxID=1396 RepID=UPI00397F8BD4